MIARWSHWRNSADRRDPVAAPGDAQSIATSYIAPRQHWGKITSRPQITRDRLEAVAYELGCTVEAARKAIEQGLI